MNRDLQHSVFDVSLEFLELRLFTGKQVQWMATSEILQVPKHKKNTISSIFQHESTQNQNKSAKKDT